MPDQQNESFKQSSSLHYKPTEIKDTPTPLMVPHTDKETTLTPPPPYTLVDQGQPELCGAQYFKEPWTIRSNFVDYSAKGCQMMDPKWANI